MGGLRLQLGSLDVDMTNVGFAGKAMAVDVSCMRPIRGDVLCHKIYFGIHVKGFEIECLRLGVVEYTEVCTLRRHECALRLWVQQDVQRGDKTTVSEDALRRSAFACTMD